MRRVSAAPVGRLKEHCVLTGPVFVLDASIRFILS